MGLIVVTATAGGMIAVGRRRLVRSEQPSRRRHGTCEQVAQSQITLALSDAIALAQILSADDDITHDLDYFVALTVNRNGDLLHDIGDSAFHVPEIGHSTHQKKQNNGSRDRNHKTRWMPV